MCLNKMLKLPKKATTGQGMDFFFCTSIQRNRMFGYRTTENTFINITYKVQCYLLWLNEKRTVTWPVYINNA